MKDLQETVIEQRGPILDRIRSRMGAYQYQVSSVVFELLQNADDAITQRGVGSYVDIVHLRMNATTWSIRHSGRRINDAQGNTQDPGGFRRDLVYMVLLHASAKLGERPGVQQPANFQSTGRFGLGFKSVYLVTDAPRVWSGWLSFEIEAGLLPKSIPERAELDRQETLIELPLCLDRKEGGAAREQVEGLLPVLPALMRSVRVIHLELPGRLASASWQPEPVSPQVEIARIASSTLFEGGGHVVKIHSSEGTSALLLWVRRGQCQPMPVEVATIWVTVPTTERWQAGFVINGPMALDVGRSRVDLQSVQTKRVLQNLGDLLRGGLQDIEDRWANCVRPALGLPEEVDGCANFLDSVVCTLMQMTLGQPEDRSAALAVMLRGDRGLAAWIRSGGQVPTGLPEPWPGRAPASAIRYVADALLQDERVHRFLEALPNGRFGPDNGLVVGEQTAAWLVWLGLVQAPAKWGLQDELSRRFPPSQSIRVEDATALVGLVDLAREVNGLRSAIAQWASQFTFASMSGEARPPMELLIPEMPAGVRSNIHVRLDGRSDTLDDLDDEARISRFAPPEYVLSLAYTQQADALWLFRRFAREQRRVGTRDQLERWARETQGSDARMAVLIYGSSGSP